MGADIPKIKEPQATPHFAFGPRSSGLITQLSQLTGRSGADIQQQVMREHKAENQRRLAQRQALGPIDTRDPFAFASVGVDSRKFTDQFLAGLVAQEQQRATPSAPTAPSAPTPVTPLPTITSSTPPAAGGDQPAARLDPAVQAAGEAEQKRQMKARGRSRTVLTPFDIPIPSTNIGKTLLGGRV